MEIKKTDDSIVDKFINEIQNFFQKGEPVTSGNQDLKYSLDLHRQRLEKRSIKMEYHIRPRGHFSDGRESRLKWVDDRYVSHMEYRTCEVDRRFSRDGKTIFHHKRNSLLYEIVTDVHNQEVAKEDTYTCPNCAATSKIADLEKGCPYCGTFYKMTDLFPKITNYYLLEDIAGTKKEFKGKVWKFILPCLLLGLLFSIIAVVNAYQSYQSLEIDEMLKIMYLGRILSGAVISVVGIMIGSVVLGCVIWAVLFLMKAVVSTGKSLFLIAEIGGSEQKFSTWMQQYSPEFSYQYFSDKVVSVLKMIMFSEKPESLPYYVGKPIGDKLKKIVDTSHVGAVALKKVETQGTYCYVTVDVYMENVYDDAKKMCIKNDTFRMVLSKNISIPVDMHFSIKKIQCKGCAASFDATRYDTCPACGRKYEIAEDDWVVHVIEKMQE